MNVETRVLTALRGGQPDRVPILTPLNPYVEDWYTTLPAYEDVLQAVETYADVVFDWSYPTPVMLTAGNRWLEQRDLGQGRIEQVIHTPDGPLTEIVRVGWRERGVVKRWIRSVEDAERALSIPYVPLRLDAHGFREARARLAGKAVAQVTMPGPTVLSEWIDPRALGELRRDHCGLLEELLDTLFDRLLEGLWTCLDAGLGPIYRLRHKHVAGTDPLTGPELTERLIDYDRRFVDTLRSHVDRQVILQADKGTVPVVDLSRRVGMDGLALPDVPLSDDCDLGRIKQALGNGACLIACLSHDLLEQGSLAQIEGWVHQTLASAARGGGFMIDLSAAVPRRTLTDQAAANLVQAMRLAHDLGRYPIPL